MICNSTLQVTLNDLAFCYLISLSTYCTVSTGIGLANTNRSNGLLVHRVFIMFMYAARPSLFYCSQPRWLLNQFIFSVLFSLNCIVSYGGWFLLNSTGQCYISNTAVCFVSTVNLTILRVWRQRLWRSRPSCIGRRVVWLKFNPFRRFCCFHRQGRSLVYKWVRITPSVELKWSGASSTFSSEGFRSIYRIAVFISVETLNKLPKLPIRNRTYYRQNLSELTLFQTRRARLP